MAYLNPTAPHPIGFGIIGCTETASQISRAVISLGRNEAFLVAVGSQPYNTAVQFISDNELPNTIPLDSYDAVIDQPLVDVVFVSLVLPTHTSLAVAAARKGKHVLLETPTARCVEELADVLEACKESRVQFMDSTMWLHHWATKEMKRGITNMTLLGNVRTVNSICTLKLDDDFLQNCDLHPLGVLIGAGWHCICTILCTNSYVLPRTVRALYAAKNDSGILLSCGALLLWPTQSASLHCSYLDHRTMQTTVIGTQGKINIFLKPYEEGMIVTNFDHDLGRGSHDTVPTTGEVCTKLSMGVSMVQKCVHLVRSIKIENDEPEMKWHDISRKTQLILDAVIKSVANEFQPVEIRG